MKKVDLRRYLSDKECQHSEMALRATDAMNADFHRQSADHFRRMVVEAAQLPEAWIPTIRVPHKSRMPNGG